MKAPFSFDPHATHFNARNADAMARASDLVYEGPQTIEERVVRQWRLRQFDYLDDDDTQVFVAANRDFTLVSFRGTESDQFSDWFTDINTDLVPGPLGGKVHAGFYDALSHVWQSLDRRVERFDDGRQKPLWVTGHSLGAGLATLAVARWLEKGRPVKGLYTFGQPRTGDTTFARNFNFEFKPFAHRIVNNNDLVTRIPTRSMGYSHVGSFKYFTEDGDFVEDIGFWDLFLDRWRGRLQSVVKLGLDGIQDHSMSGYRECIDRLLYATPPEEAWPRLSTGIINGVENPMIRPRRRAA